MSPFSTECWSTLTELDSLVQKRFSKRVEPTLFLFLNNKIKSVSVKLALKMNFKPQSNQITQLYLNNQNQNISYRLPDL